MGELNILISLIAAEGSGMCSPQESHGHLYTARLHLSGFRQHPKLCWVLLALFLQETFTLSIIPVPRAGGAAAGTHKVEKNSRADVRWETTLA